MPPIVRPSGGTSSTLAPIKSKTMPERLRLNNIRPIPVKPTDIKPPSPSQDTQLAPLKVAKAKQNPVPLNIKPQHAGPGSPREVGTPEGVENGKQWARKVKTNPDPLNLSPFRFVNCNVVITEPARKDTVNVHGGFLILSL